MSLATSIKRSAVPGGLRCLSEPGHALRVSWVGESISHLVRKPNAGKLHVRFDERDLETEDMVSYSGTGIPKGPAHRLRLNLTPPRQISTLPTAQKDPVGVGQHFGHGGPIFSGHGRLVESCSRS